MRFGGRTVETGAVAGASTSWDAPHLATSRWLEHRLGRMIAELASSITDYSASNPLRGAGVKPLAHATRHPIDSSSY